MSEFTDIWGQLPFVSRHVTALAAITFLLRHLFYWSYPHIFILERFPVTRPWTLVTSAFSSTVGNPMTAVMTVAFLWLHLSSLEQNSRLSRRSDLVFFIVFVQIGCIIVGPSLSIPGFFEVHASAITYYHSQESPYSNTLLFGLLPVTLGFLPWINAVLALVINSPQACTESLLGIFLSHLFIFLTELLPQAGGPQLETPALLKHYIDGVGPSHKAPVSASAKSSAKPSAGAKLAAEDAPAGSAFSSGYGRFSGQGRKLGGT